MTHICVDKLTTTGSDNGLSPGRRQVIIWTTAGILIIGPLGTNFSEILIGIHTFSFKAMHLKMLSAKWRPFCLGRNMLKRPLGDSYWFWKHPSERHRMDIITAGLIESNQAKQGAWNHVSSSSKELYSESPILNLSSLWQISHPCRDAKKIIYQNRGKCLDKVK